MKLKIEFQRDAGYHEKDLTLLLMRYFNPTKFTLDLGSTWGNKIEVVMEGAVPINPFEAMEQINEAMTKKIKDWPQSFSIPFIEMETQEEKEKIPTWVLIDKLKSKTLI